MKTVAGSTRRTVVLLIAALAAPLMGDEQSAQIEKLVAVMTGSYDTSSWNAVASLASIGPPAIPALDRVIRKHDHAPIKDFKEAARYQAIFALGRMGPLAEPEIDLLVSLVEDKTEGSSIRWASAAALGEIGRQPEKVIPALTRVLEDPKTPKSNLCGYVLEALKKSGPQVGRAKRLIKKYDSKRLCRCDACGDV